MIALAVVAYGAGTAGVLALKHYAVSRWCK